MDVVEAALIKHTEALDGLCNFFSYERFTCEDFYETFCDNAREIQGKDLNKVKKKLSTFRFMFNIINLLL